MGVLTRPMQPATADESADVPADLRAELVRRASPTYVDIIRSFRTIHRAAMHLHRKTGPLHATDREVLMQAVSLLHQLVAGSVVEQTSVSAMGSAA